MNEFYYNEWNYNMKLHYETSFTAYSCITDLIRSHQIISKGFMEMTIT